MSSLLTTLGLRPNPLGFTPNLAPYHVIAQFFFAFVFLSARSLKNSYKIDHNISPREDLTKYGEKYVQDGKLTRKQLNLLKRNEAAHANSMEHFPVFVGSVLFATVSAVKPEVINGVCLAYGVARLVYAAAYLLVDRDVRLSYVRSLSWWAGSLAIAAGDSDLAPLN
ncbi:hypothetical protein H2200_013011 [Cladophialophora chaetospira]|uniref:Microsomal glutathione S-transferase 3 n=1 Tax=Cladophialophora chaetospira TaxID=386627 RepID=A0AA38WWK4_9EURO|nr:hypothetical protein H2200_013011 [Cladophialophora chaetospira]